jgi:molecular chaperone Hsp33
VAEVPADSDGELRRFILERHPVRGCWVRLDGAWRELRSHQRYPPAVEALLGEAVAASLLLAATLKFQGTLPPASMMASTGPWPFGSWRVTAD